MTPFVVIGLGGVLGANARFLISSWAADRYGADFPFGTFLINASGSFAMGLVLTLLAGWFGDFTEARFLLTTGFLGAYTTFSTFTYETIVLLREAEIKPALFNALGSAVIGIGGCGGGVTIAEVLVGWLR